MYYSDDIIEEVRQRNSIVDVIGSYVKLQHRGTNYFGLCPFHNEKTGSFCVFPSRQTYHCFGCGKGGNVITFIMDYENESFIEALNRLAERAGVTLPKQDYTKEMQDAKDERTRLLKIQKDAAIYYVKLLRTPEGKTGLDYLLNRGLSAETIRSFGLGYGGKGFGALYKHLKSLGYSDTDLQKSGLVRLKENGTSDYFFNRVIFPIFDTNSRVIAFGGRVMGEGEPKYLNSPETRIFEKSRTLYGLHAAKKSREDYFLICEGYMDVISLHQAGFTNAVASLGTAFTNQHGIIMKRYVNMVILCYDSDGAGKKAALRAIPILKEAGLRVKVLNLSPYKDPDEFIKALGADSFRDRIKEAKNAFLFEAEVLREGYDFSDPDAKSRYFNELAEKLAGFSDEIERNAYIETISKLYGIDYTVLKNKVNLIGNSRGFIEKPKYENLKKDTPSGKIKQEKGFVKAERLILSELAENHDLYLAVSGILNPKDFSGEIAKKVAEILYLQHESGKVSPASVLSHFIDDDNYSCVAELFSDSIPVDTDGKTRTMIIKEAVFSIKSAGLEREISKAEDFGIIQKLSQEKQTLKTRIDKLSF